MVNPPLISEIIAQPQAIAWLPWAVQYFFFIGIAACGALLACWLHWRSPENSRLEGITLFLTLTCAIVAPLALTADLHQPARVWHFYAWPTPWSWMPWGAVFLPLFTLFIGLWFVAFHLQRFTGRRFALNRWITVATALTAVGLLLYTGREVSVVRARPIWFGYTFPLVMFFSALQTLLALLMVDTPTTGRGSRMLGTGQVGGLVLLGITCAVWLSGDTLSSSAFRQWLQLSGRARGFAIIILAVWLCCLTLAVYVSRKGTVRKATIPGVVMAMGLCWLLRWTLLMEVQTVPKFNALVNPYSLPFGSDGWLAIVGTFGLWLALMIVVRESMNWIAGRVQHG
ncbi:tetrathionate reductase subunit TtrC [Kluyvera intermedia]|uniref:tetrathionate reductase subunit TtrC n=1 Tax=Kluyvera intermedia TaxID=61648 RepID=UPI003523403D